MYLIEIPVTIEENDRVTHGWRHTRIYSVWLNMRQRCNNPKNPAHHYYGGRGISICKEWDDAGVFCEWAMNNGYDTTLTIDRINSDGNYEPDNCRWITLEDQQSNKRNNIWIEIDGKKLSIPEISVTYDIPESTLYQKYGNGLRGVDLIDKHMLRGLTSNGEYKNLRQISEHFGIPLSTVKARWGRGIRDERLTHVKLKRGIKTHETIAK